ncbi:MAG: hypothetical protein FJ137_14360 [Deltaproteobacteria bacterium]|nr:hypothetical protein [Deltaproteobacteria bacterium]
MFEGFPQRLERLRSRVRAVRRAAADVKRQTDQALQALGVQTAPPSPVIDVQPGRTAARSAARAVVARALQGVAAVAATVLLGLALLSLGMFVGAALLAFVVVTRGLGLHIDWRPPVSA